MNISTWLSADGLASLKEKTLTIMSEKAIYHVLLAAAIIVAASIVQICAYRYGERKANYRLTKLLKYTVIFPDTLKIGEGDFRSVLVDKGISDSISYVTLPLPPVVNCKVKRIHQQLTDVALKSHNHFIVAKEFMIQSFVCITTASIFFITAGIAIAFVTKSGFGQANALLITTLICTIGVGTFFTSLTSIFKQEKNANDNLGLYLKYINLEQAIRSELVTNRLIVAKAQMPCDTLDNVLDNTIKSIDKRMEEINSIALGFDVSLVRSLSTLDVKDFDKEELPK